MAEAPWEISIDSRTGSEIEWDRHEQHEQNVRAIAGRHRERGQSPQPSWGQQQRQRERRMQSHNRQYHRYGYHGVNPGGWYQDTPKRSGWGQFLADVRDVIRSLFR
jgi:hypothetical protein